MNDVKDTVFIVRLITQFERYFNIIFRGIFTKLNGYYTSAPTLFFYAYLEDMTTIVPYNNSEWTHRVILKTTINTTIGYRRFVDCA